MRHKWWNRHFLNRSFKCLISKYFDMQRKLDIRLLLLVNKNTLPRISKFVHQFINFFNGLLQWRLATLYESRISTNFHECYTLFLVNVYQINDNLFLKNKNRYHLSGYLTPRHRILQQNLCVISVLQNIRKIGKILWNHFSIIKLMIWLLN